MKRIAVFYHALLSGPGICSNFALDLMTDQMLSLKESGLANAADYMFVGCNGPDDDMIPLACYVLRRTDSKCWLNGKSEIPTMRFMREWCQANPDHYVLYFHMKGVSHGPTDPYKKWRECMERVCIWDWKSCVEALDAGYDSAGAHWCTSKLNYLVTVPMWGGNYFWAKSDFLATLPEFSPDAHDKRYEAESWIGLGKKLPKVRDFAPHWPMQGCVGNGT